MVKKTYTLEQTINKLREAEVLISQGTTIAEASSKIGVTDQTYSRCHREYGGTRVDQARRLKELVTELSLDISILKEAARVSFATRRRDARWSCTYVKLLGSRKDGHAKC